MLYRNVLDAVNIQSENYMIASIMSNVISVLGLSLNSTIEASFIA